MFIESKTWKGLPAEGMAGVYSLIGTSLGHSPRSEQPSGEEEKKTSDKRLEHAPKRLTGTIIFYRGDRGFGFIKQAAGKDIFFHITDAAEPGLTQFAPGERVRYELGEKDGKPAAIKITLDGGMK
ncbi:cold shock domain-containing protein [Paenibacillus vini]|uniref:cold-shock protein n=1 Tax=Paenibacillus vini TaxID=1476024 RepID=UPI0025B64190|nr:cold shock domain-containing protein [Paenibacillus vini]MDN4069704.1 cold shock domain-containing protein [Paenibacillus vini]